MTIISLPRQINGNCISAFPEAPLKIRAKLSYDFQNHDPAYAIISFVFKGVVDNSKILMALTDLEQQTYNKYKQSRRKESYLLGRYCAKQAIKTLSKNMDFSSFSIISGQFNQPLIRGTGTSGLSISISHSQSYAAAIAFYDSAPFGIDIQTVQSENKKSMLSIGTNSEIELIKETGWNEESALTLLWCAKESLAKAIKTGFLIAPQNFEISSIKSCNGYVIVSYKNFPLFTSFVFRYFTTVVSITKPKNTNILSLEECLDRELYE